MRNQKIVVLLSSLLLLFIFQNCAPFGSFSTKDSSFALGTTTPSGSLGQDPGQPFAPPTTPSPIILPGQGLRNLYVHPQGSDTHSGTMASPFRTIAKALSLATPGYSIHVADGVYKEKLRLNQSGTPEAYISILSENKWGAKILALDSAASGTAFDIRGSYVLIDGFEVDGSASQWTVGINVAGTGDIVSNCLVHHIYNTGVANGSGGAGILLDSWYGFNNMQALSNVVHHVGPATGGSSWYHGIYQTATGNIFNNIVYANTGGGIHLWHDVNHVNVSNNTSFGNGHGFLFGGGDFVNTTGPADYVNFTNNISFDNDGIGFDEEGQVGPHNKFTQNLSFQNGTNWRLKLASHSGDVTADPQFVNYIRGGGGDYHLKSNSPAIDQGSTMLAPATDYDGLPRPQGSGIDLGAYEFKL